MKLRLIRLAAAAVGLVLMACAGEPAPKTAAAEDDARPSGAAGNQNAMPEDDAALLALLPSAKVDLAEGIAQAEAHGARAISAKFELEGSTLSLSVYTAKKGLEPDAEHNVLAEVSGDATQPVWSPKEEVFQDAKHLTRASYHLTLLQRSKLSLSAVISKALAQQRGRVYSIEPAIHERSPIFHVLIATAGGGHVKVDVESGA